MNKIIKETIKQACIEAQNNKFITPIVFRQSIKLREELKQQILKGMPEKTDNNYWIEKLKVPSSDYSYGHRNGYNQALDNVTQSIERLFEGKEGK